MRVAIGSDHAGFELKEDLKPFLAEEGLEVADFGTENGEAVDYPDVGKKVSLVVAGGDYDLGILVCGTGIGMSITANKIAGIRAALCGDTFSARAAREHNNANILVLGNRVIGKGLARDIVKAWLGASFLGGRHAARVDKINQLEKDWKK